MIDYSVRNTMVSKEKSSEFLEELSNNTILQDCAILRVLPSGNYLIFTFKIDLPEQREELKRIADDWI
ncbi:MAG: hypothetical protein GX682_04755 [Clostridiaceae bacterium]|nr:hypothetical protein [Clostridiaceae bacterium]